MAGRFVLRNAAVVTSEHQRSARKSGELGTGPCFQSMNNGSRGNKDSNSFSENTEHTSGGKWRWNGSGNKTRVS